MSHFQQPMGTPQMTLAGNRNAKGLPLNNGKREWSYGLCDCFGSCGTCLVASFCPCIIYGKVKKRYEHLHTKGYPDPDHGGCCTGTCMGHCCVTGCGFGWIMQMMTRADIRGRYSIEGGGMGDCCTAFCCTPCELTQESRELELEEKTYGGKH